MTVPINGMEISFADKNSIVNGASIPDQNYLRSIWESAIMLLGKHLPPAYGGYDL